MMVSDNSSSFGTGFTVSIEAAENVTTGISAADRAVTIRAAVAADAKPEDIVRVGDVYKMRVLKIEADQRKLGLSIRAFVESTGEDPLVKRAPEPEPVPEPPASKPEEAKGEPAGAVAEAVAASESVDEPESGEAAEKPEA